MGNRPRTVMFQGFKDPRGNLLVMDTLEKSVGFCPHRVFVIQDVPDASCERGVHAHPTGRQAIGCTLGGFSLTTEGPDGQSNVWQMEQGVCVVVPPMHWITLSAFTPAGTALVLCSETFAQANSIQYKDEWREACGR